MRWLLRGEQGLGARAASRATHEKEKGLGRAHSEPAAQRPHKRGPCPRHGSLGGSLVVRLRALGVSIAIDDFGTGYSSLQYLGRLPFDTIKIDQSFIRELATDARAAETVRAISSLARTHGKLIVAEGVETEAQANWLAGIGCEFVQGYFYARSRDAATLRMDLARQAA